MRNAKSLLVMCLIALVAHLPLRAAAASPSQTLLELIGFDAFLGGFSQSMRGTHAQFSGGDQNLARAWELAAKLSFEPSRLMADIVTEMDRELSGDFVAVSMAFFETDLGRLVTDMEIAAQTPDPSVNVDVEGGAILADLIEQDTERLNAYTDLIDALGAIDSGVTAAMNLNFAIYLGMFQSSEQTYQLSEAEILELVLANHEQFRAAIRDQVYVTFAYTYRDLSDEDLAQYTAFLTSPAGRSLYSNINRATEIVLERHARDFGERLMELRGTEEL